MITREKYLESLEIIDQYHQQLIKVKSNFEFDREWVIDWLHEQQENISTRLYNALKGSCVKKNGEKRYREFITYMDELNMSTFLKIRYAGAKSWIELCNILSSNSTKTHQYYHNKQ